MRVTEPQTSVSSSSRQKLNSRTLGIFILRKLVRLKYLQRFWIPDKYVTGQLFFINKDGRSNYGKTSRQMAKHKPDLPDAIQHLISKFSVLPLKYTNLNCWVVMQRRKMAEVKM